MTIQRSYSSSLADQKSLIVCCDQMLVVCISRILFYYDSTFAAQRYPEDQQLQRSIPAKNQTQAERREQEFFQKNLALDFSVVRLWLNINVYEIETNFTTKLLF